MINADEKKICAALGVSEEEYLKARNAENFDNTHKNFGKSLKADEKEICWLCGVSETDYLKNKCQ